MQAPGGPGAAPSWGPGRKQGFGSAPGQRSKVWFTIADGNLSEVYHPSVDRPVLRGLRFLVAAPGSPPVDDASDARHTVRWAQPGLPSFQVDSLHHEYRLTKDLCCDPDLDALILLGTYTPNLPDLHLFLQAAPHLVAGSEGNQAEVLDRDPPILVARQGEVWMALVGPFAGASVGYLNSSDLFVDLHDSDGSMTAFYRTAGPGSVALGAEIGVRTGSFQLALGFARSRDEAEDVALQVLHKGYGMVREDFERAWRAQPDLPSNLLRVSADGGALARSSLAVLRCLEDKTERGAFVAAPCAAWGESQGQGGRVYHVVRPRDLYHIATALLDAGDPAPAQRALRYLERRQRPDGGWARSFGVDGRPHRDHPALDQVALPILLAWRLGLAGALDHDPYPTMVRPAAIHLIRHGPWTPLDRWEDAGGISPSTVAAMVAALLVAAEFADEAGETPAGAHLRAVADYWSDRLEHWCYLRSSRHYVRLSSDLAVGASREDAVGVEFWELVRRGLRRADDFRVLSSLDAVDALLRIDTPAGPGWRRYVGDDYGETDAGEPWGPGGRGRAWPLLTGERAHLTLARGDQVGALIMAMERFAGPELLLPEQVWDAPDISARGLRPGVPTGSATPLGWAHAEYLRLLAAVSTGSLPDVVEPARTRYSDAPPREPAFVWTRAHALPRFLAGRRVKIQLDAPATVHWTADDWATHKEVEAQDSLLGVWVAELPTDIMRPGATMEWTVRHRTGWEGRTYTLTCEAEAD